MKQNNRGFSLIETVVAMAILGAFTVSICTCLMLSIRMCLHRFYLHMFDAVHPHERENKHLNAGTNGSLLRSGRVDGNRVFC